MIKVLCVRRSVWPSSNELIEQQFRKREARKEESRKQESRKEKSRKEKSHEEEPKSAPSSKKRKSPPAEEEVSLDKVEIPDDAPIVRFSNSPTGLHTS